MNLPKYTKYVYINGQIDIKNCHSGAMKTNKFQSGFRDLKNDRKKSGFDAADFFKQNKQ